MTGLGSGDFSNLPITRTTVLPLLVTGPLAFIAAWKFSPSATIVLAAVALSAHTVFRRITCSPMRQRLRRELNVHYREWKRAQGSAPGDPLGTVSSGVSPNVSGLLDPQRVHVPVEAGAGTALRCGTLYPWG